jgi:hypothetical protein
MRGSTQPLPVPAFISWRACPGCVGSCSQQMVGGAGRAKILRMPSRTAGRRRVYDFTTCTRGDMLERRLRLRLLQLERQPLLGSWPLVLFLRNPSMSYDFWVRDWVASLTFPTSALCFVFSPSLLPWTWVRFASSSIFFSAGGSVDWWRVSGCYGCYDRYPSLARLMNYTNFRI